jgi:inner membrane protein
VPTIITHGVVPLFLGLALGRERIARPVLVAGVILSMLPDADVVGFKLGIKYADQLGHRGASHALIVALAVGLIVTLALRPRKPAVAGLFLSVSMASHGLLDSLTNGGLGPALLWPASATRYFAPFRPIAVSPIGIDFSRSRALSVLTSEIWWVWLPVGTLGVIMVLLCRRRRQSGPPLRP